jgi:drug/metabolite transporter (DMT)-like permease
MTPLGLATWRELFGAILLAVVVAVMRRRGRPLVNLRRLPRRVIGALTVAAISAMVINLAIFVAFGRITVALALLAFYTYPALVAAVAILIDRRRPDRIELSALALALIGMTFVVLGQLDPAAGLVVDALGLGLAVLASLGQTVYITSNRGFSAIPAEQAATLLLWVGTLAYVLIAFATGSVDGIGEPFRNPAVWPYLLFAGLLGAGVPALLFLVAIRLIGPVRTGILAMLEPVTGTVLAAIVLGETIGPIQLVGGALVITAGVLLQRDPTPVDAPPASPIPRPTPG